MQGTDKTTGKPLSGLAHLRQSIEDILTTPIGSRVMRRDYGSNLLNLIDRPLNGESKVDFYAAIGEALDRWEPRFRLTRTSLESVDEGHLAVNIEGEYLPDGREIKLEGIIV